MLRYADGEMGGLLLNIFPSEETRVRRSFHLCIIFPGLFLRILLLHSVHCGLSFRCSVHKPMSYIILHRVNNRGLIVCYTPSHLVIVVQPQRFQFL
jgi:hypothetical protein